MSDNKRFTYQKYGLFVHYVPGLSVDSKGMTYPPEQTADAFDVEGFARDVASTGAEYVIFTAWHAGMYLLYPSPVMENYCPGRSVRRDLVGELIEALHRYGIAVWLYTHPYLGYHLTEEERIRTGYGAKNDPVNPSFPDSSTFCHERWNEFVCAVYGELAERYGSKLDGLFMDEGTSEAKMADYVDFPRLRRVILERAPGLLLMQNFYGTPYACDLGMKEYGPGWGEFRFSPDRWPCYEIPVTVVCSEDWMAKKPAGQKVLRFNPEDMFRYTVLQASTNHDGGGVCWAAGM